MVPTPWAGPRLSVKATDNLSTHFISFDRGYKEDALNFMMMVYSVFVV